MAVVTSTFTDTKDKNVRLRDGGPNQGNGKDLHLIIGRHAGAGVDYQHRAYILIPITWTAIGKIVKAELVLTTSSQVHVSFGSKPSVQVQRLYSEAIVEGNAGEGPVWDGAEYQAIPRVTAGLATGTVLPTEQTAFRIDITDIVEAWAPASVQKRDGSQGGAQANLGLGVYGKPETDTASLVEVYSREHGTAGFRPHIDITYEHTNQPPDAPDALVPTADVVSAPFFEGDFSDPDTGDFMTQAHVQVIDRNTNGPVIWETYHPVSSSERDANRFSVPVPALLRSGIEYEWRARVADSKGVWGNFSNATPPYTWFKITNDAPTCVLQPLGSYVSLSAVHFRGAFSDPNSGDMLGSYHIQFRPQTAPDVAAWDQTDHLWDTGPLTPTLSETAHSLFDRTYGGQPLAAGTYTWRARVADNWGSWSPWVYDDLVLTAAWSPDPGSIDLLTNYSPKKTPARVVIRGITGDLTLGGRGPALDPADLSKFAPPLAVIDDATNLGASKYLNSPGEFFMTLPATHPQVSVIEPYQVHYAVELWNNDRWREVFAGLITDFDATADDVVFYGVDYLGLLGMSVDDRFDKAAPDKPHTQGGSKYVDQSISTIILDQLAMAKAGTDSPVDFITNGAMDTFAEHVTILATFKQRLPFISGLLDSHRQGTGKRSRLQVRRKTNAAYEWVLTDDPGVDRNNLRMEFGGLVQGFRLTAFGDFGTYVHGLGRTPTGVNIMYKTESAPGIAPARYGRIAKVNVWTDLIDENDLVRRTKQAAATAGRVGKRIALAIRTDAVQPFDGYDIADSIPVHIQRGVVDTERYGSGLWSILGVEMKVTPQGALDNTFVILPKEDGVPPDADLIPSAPILSDQTQWQTGAGDPDASITSDFWLNYITGELWGRTGTTWVRLPVHATSIADGTVTTPSIAPEGLDGVVLTTGEVGSGGVGVIGTVIDEGALPGGHNNVLNSSFELANFGAAAPVSSTWDLAADWTATRVGSDTNVTTGAGALTETGMTY